MEAALTGDADAGPRPAAVEAPAAPAEGAAHLQPGRPLRGRFAVTRKDRLTSRKGSPYIVVELRDRTGSIEARIFREADQLGARFERGDAIEVRGKVERFRGELQAEITALRKLKPGSFDPAEFLPSAYRSLDELDGFLEHLSREIHDPTCAPRRRVARRRARSEPSYAARPARAAVTTPIWAGSSSTRSPSRRWSGEALRTLCTTGSADGVGAAARHRQDARVHLRRRLPHLATRAACSAICRSAGR